MKKKHLSKLEWLEFHDQGSSNLAANDLYNMDIQLTYILANFFKPNIMNHNIGFHYSHEKKKHL